MYVPKHFRIDDLAVLHAAMHDAAAATIVSQGPDGLIATHVPIELCREVGDHGSIRCHFARANPHAAAIAETIAGGEELLAIFQGPQGYISPAWYPSKLTNDGKVVPTWNYLAIHAYGTARTFDDFDRLLPHLEALTNRHEAARAEPWAVSDAPDEFVRTLAQGIVGFEITITRIDGKKKMSQNRPPADRKGTVAGLKSHGRADLARLIEEEE